jgi:hypothetical protein
VRMAFLTGVTLRGDSNLSSDGGCLSHGGEIVRYPTAKDGRLVTGLHRNSAYLFRCVALASRSVTSGASDNRPVLVQHAGPGALFDRERFTPGRILPGNAANAQLERCQCGRTVSLRRAGVPKPTGRVYHKREDGAYPSLKRRGLRAAER